MPNIIMADPKTAKPNPHNLPSAYTEYEYIEASGTQYINTGYVPTADTEIVATTLRTAVQGYNAYDWAVYVNPKALTAGKYWAWGSVQDKQSEAYDVDHLFGPKTARVNISGVYDLIGTRIVNFGTVTWQTGNNPIYLFCRNNSGTAERFSMVKIYYWAAWENGTKMVEFIPAKRNSDGVLGMYDTVSGAFFENAGSGVFTGGELAA